MRIQAGTYKGRKLLPPPKGAATRPITGSVKKSLFGMLTGRLDGAAVLDLYCGAGTLGLEAISGGAASCCFAERDRRVIHRLRRNIEALGCGEQCDIWRGDIATRLAGWLKQLPRPVDVAFIDPPYALSFGWDWADAEARLFAPLARHLADDGLVVLRVAGKVNAPQSLGGLVIVRGRRYGDAQLLLYGKTEQA